MLSKIVTNKNWSLLENVKIERFAKKMTIKKHGKNIEQMGSWQTPFVFVCTLQNETSRIVIMLSMRNVAGQVGESNGVCHTVCPRQRMSQQAWPDIGATMQIISLTPGTRHAFIKFRNIRIDLRDWHAHQSAISTFFSFFKLNKQTFYLSWHQFHFCLQFSHNSFRCLFFFQNNSFCFCLYYLLQK